MSKLLNFALPCAMAIGAGGHVGAQTLMGWLGDPALHGKEIILKQARGADLVPFDSVRIADDGNFRFQETFAQTGFYQLVVNDSDLVNIVLDSREPLVDLHFAQLPLEDNLKVITSEENKRVQEFRYIIDETYAIKASVRKQKTLLSHTDTAQLLALERVEARAQQTQDDYLESLAADSAISYFARNFVINSALGTLRGKGPMAVAAVFNFSDPQLMRSTTYDGAVMAFLQNLNVIKESQFVLASDTLLMLAGRSPETRAYMLEHLIDLFSTYGPEIALQHVIDRYVVPDGREAQLPERLLDKVRGLMAVSVGRTAPDVELDDQGRKHRLSEVAAAGRYTALFFYSSTCEHCHAQMPGLKADLERYKGRGFQVVGIALDTDSAEFLLSIRENDIPWKCYSEFNGWGSTVAKAFEVRGTPSFFLLDNKLGIIAKPRDAEELAEVLDKLLR